MSSIVLTGGGSAGHVTPHLALIPALRAQHWTLSYIGSCTGIERDIITRENIPYYPISTGKFRRHLTWRHVLEPFQVIKGIWDAWWHLRQLKPQLVFSKGGFVAFPVVFSAWLRRIPVIAHESDVTPGLANRLSFPFVTRLCVTFEQTKAAFSSQDKVLLTGTPIRRALFQGDPQKALARCHFSGEKPVLLVMGGSLGAKRINQAIRDSLPILCRTYHVIHLCGQDNLEAKLQDMPDYFQCEYAHEDMGDFLSASRFVVSRAGANAVYELLALGKPHVFIPLSTQASRGDQVENAAYFEAKGASLVLPDHALTAQTLLEKINQGMAQHARLAKHIKALNIQDATERLMRLFEAFKI